MKSKKLCLFTPGPLNTSDSVRAVMNQDIGSRTETLVQLTKNIRSSLEKIAQCGSAYTSILLQGSGTFAVEAMIASLIPSNAHVLVISNGVYGERIIQICDIHGISYVALRSPETIAIDLNQVQQFLENSPIQITHIIAVHFETAIGIFNDINALTALATKYHCSVLIDAMSTFGALPLNYKEPSLCAIAASSNKCLHGVPGIGFVIARVKALSSTNLPKTLSLDLVSQWQTFEKNGEWRFTPPTQVLLAFNEALDEFQKMGGVSARFKKYADLTFQLITAFEPLGIYPVIPEKYRAPMITTFILGKSCVLNFLDIYQQLWVKNFILYPSSSLSRNHVNRSFRVGCMGEINEHDINNLVDAMKNIIHAGDYCEQH